MRPTRLPVASSGHARRALARKVRDSSRTFRATDHFPLRVLQARGRAFKIFAAPRIHGSSRATRPKSFSFFPGNNPRCSSNPRGTAANFAKGAIFLHWAMTRSIQSIGRAASAAIATHSRRPIEIFARSSAFRRDSEISSPDGYMLDLAAARPASPGTVGDNAQ